MSTNESDPKVVVVGQESIKKPWATGVFYRHDGRKLTLMPKQVVWAAVVLFILTSSVALLSSPEEEPPQQGTAKNVPIPPMSSESNFDKEFKENHQSSNNSATINNQANGAEKPKLPRLQVILRSTAGIIPPGSMVKAKLISGASNGPVRALVLENLTVADELRLERGSTLIGQGQSSEERLFIRFRQIVKKDGSVEDWDAQACDLSDQVVGLKGERVSGQALKLAAGAALNFVGGLSEGLQDTEAQGGVLKRPPTLRNALLNGAANAALDQARDIMSGTRSQPIIIEVPTGTVFYAMGG